MTRVDSTPHFGSPWVRDTCTARPEIISFSPRHCIANLRPRLHLTGAQHSYDYLITSASTSVHRSISMCEVMNDHLITNLARQQRELTYQGWTWNRKIRRILVENPSMLRCSRKINIRSLTGFGHGNTHCHLIFPNTLGTSIRGRARSKILSNHDRWTRYMK